MFDMTILLPWNIYWMLKDSEFKENLDDMFSAYGQGSCDWLYHNLVAVQNCSCTKLQWILTHTSSGGHPHHCEKALIRCKDLNIKSEYFFSLYYMISIVYNRLKKSKSDHRKTLSSHLWKIYHHTLQSQYYIMEKNN